MVTRGGEGPIKQSEINPVRTARKTKSHPLNRKATEATATIGLLQL